MRRACECGERECGELAGGDRVSVRVVCGSAERVSGELVSVRMVRV